MEESLDDVEYLQQEIYALQQDVDDLEERADAAEIAAHIAEKDREAAWDAVAEMEAAMAAELAEKHKVLVFKMLKYVDLIDAYEELRKQYAARTEWKMPLNKINNLRKAGGYNEI